MMTDEEIIELAHMTRAVDRGEGDKAAFQTMLGKATLSDMTPKWLAYNLVGGELPHRDR
jgi:hypothetical protein